MYWQHDFLPRSKQRVQFSSSAHNLKARWRKTLVAVQAASPDIYFDDDASAEDLEKETLIGKSAFKFCEISITAIMLVFQTR